MEGKLCFEKLLAHAPRYEVREHELKRIHTEFVQGWEPKLWGSGAHSRAGPARSLPRAKAPTARGRWRRRCS